MRIFEESKISSKGKVLSRKEYLKFSGFDNPKLNDEKMIDVLKNAEKFLDESIPVLPLSLYRQFKLTGNRTNYQDLYFKRRVAVATLALAEYYENKGRFVDKISDYVWAILEESTWIIPAHTWNSPLYPGTDVPEVFSDDGLHGIDLFSAGTCANLANVYILTKDKLDKISPIIAKRMKYEILDRSVRPYLSATFNWTGERGNTVNNWCPWITENILYTTACIEDNAHKREMVVEKAINSLDNFTEGYFDDGGCDEGPGYWGAAGASLFDACEIIYDITGGKCNIFDNVLLRKIGEYEAKFNIDGRRFINFADCHAKLNVDGDLITRFGRRTNSEMLEAFGKMMASMNKTQVEHPHGYRTLKNFTTEKIKDAPKTKADKKVYFDGIKVAILRENEDTSLGMFLAMKGGHNSESHNHNDVGNFLIYRNGNPIFIDAGVGRYSKKTFSPQRYEIWSMQSCYHNLPTFNGTDEHNGENFRSSNEVFDSENSRFTLNLENAYPKTSELISYRREGTLKPDEVSIVDTVSLISECETVFHFLTATEPVLKKDGVLEVAEDCEFLFNKDFECEIEKFIPENINAKSEFGSEYFYRINLKTVQKDFTATFTVKAKK